MSYNASNSTPRSGFGQHNTHRCPYCEHEFRFVKVPFSTICSNCGEYINGENLISLSKQDDDKL